MTVPRRPALTLSRSEARSLLQARIDQAKEISPGRIRSADDLTRSEEREKKWRAYNVDMLRSMFTTDEYADEYANSRKRVHFAADRYNDPSIGDFELRLIENLRSQVANLDSIVERLEFVEESTTAPAQIEAVQRDLTKVFVVHGHDQATRETVARFIGKLGFEAIILHERPNKGRTIITKFREEAAGAGFAVVLMTPDDVGGSAEPLLVGKVQPRARQNVVFELGFFIGALGPDRVAALVKGDIERPSDFDGVVYISLDNGSWQIDLGRELQAAGYEIDLNRVMRG